MNVKNGYIVWSIFIIAGLFLFVLYGIMNAGFWKEVILALASSLFISGSFSVFHSLVARKDDERFFTRLFNISESVKNSGLQDIMTDSKEYSFKSDIGSARQFTAVMNDGRTWVSTHSGDLLERLKIKGASTSFFFVDPEGPFIPALALKTNYDEAELRNKIRESINNLKDLYKISDKKGSLTIGLLKNYPTQSLFFADNRVIVSPYQVACGRNTVPAYVYSCESGHETIGEFLKKDLANVLAESKLIWKNGNDNREEII